MSPSIFSSQAWTPAMRSRFESACDAQGGFEAAVGARTLKLMDCKGEQGAPTRDQVQELIVVARRKSAEKQSYSYVRWHVVKVPSRQRVPQLVIVAATAPLGHGASCSLCQGRRCLLPSFHL
jgi:hypothetical protein